jgi:NAD(P)-dependent dehydrogenase (short-subunit alcohol dehydrogenase family)
MKIAITGHTRGIGKAIHDKFVNDGHEVIGLSRSNGYDLSDSVQREEAFKHIVSSDMFINNAFVSFREPTNHQTFIPIELLFRVHRHWLGKSNKRIFVIGSWSSQFNKLDYDYTGYQIHKFALEKACWTLCLESLYPRIFLLKPGRVDTAMSANRNGPKMDPEEIANLIDLILKLENNIYVREITFTAGVKYQ